MATGTAAFPGRPYTLRIEVWYNWQSGNQASQHTEVWIDGCYGSWSGAGSSFEVYVDSVGRVQAWSGGYDFRDSCNHLIHVSDYMVTVNANGDSGAQVYANYDSLGYAQTSTWYDGSPPLPPNPPTNLHVLPETVTTTSFTVAYNRGYDNGSGLDRTDNVYWATDPGFANMVWNDGGATGGPQGASNPSGFVTLLPGTTYYIKAFSHNVNGWSGPSATISYSTLPAVAPGMTPTASPSGLSATVTFTPPGGTTGVSFYTLEYRLGSTGSVTSVTTTTPSITVTGLTPGAVYEYRASATYGSYTSPVTAWTPLIQPNPSTSPGDYFDGSTAATADQTYRWTGTVNASTSEAVGAAPTGWLTFVVGAGASGGTGAVAVVSDPKSGSKGARATFFTDATGAEFRIGTAVTDPGRTDVTGGASYVGTIFVKPSRSQRMLAELYWTDTAGGFIAATWGTPTVVPAGSWTQLTVIGNSPANAEWAGIRALDVAGTGWSTWKGGDTITADAAMVTLGAVPIDYFDGSFTRSGDLVYSWMGDPHQSASIRESFPSLISEELLDPDCPPVPLPPRPPIISDPCITDTGLWRRYYAMIPASAISDWLDVLPTFELRTYGLPERQVRIRIYPNPFNYPLGQVDTANWCGEQIVSYIPATSTILLDGELQRTFASVSGGPTIAADHLVYGTGGAPATWPVLTCGMSYMVSFDTPVGGEAPPPGNLTTTITLTRRT